MPSIKWKAWAGGSKEQSLDTSRHREGPHPLTPTSIQFGMKPRKTSWHQKLRGRSKGAGKASSSAGGSVGSIDLDSSLCSADFDEQRRIGGSLCNIGMFSPKADEVAPGSEVPQSPFKLTRKTVESIAIATTQALLSPLSPSRIPKSPVKQKEEGSTQHLGLAVQNTDDISMRSELLPATAAPSEDQAVIQEGLKRKESYILISDLNAEESEILGGMYTDTYRLVETIYSSTGPRHSNEDRYLYSILPPIQTPPMQDMGQVTCFGVFDGHGGHNCAQFLTEKLEMYLLEAKAWNIAGLDLPDRLQRALVESLAMAEEDFMEMAIERVDCSGACVVFGLYCNSCVCMANIGDSLAVIHFPGSNSEKGEWFDLSVPHRSYEESEMRRITEAGGLVVNRRAFGVLEPSRSIGDKDVKLYCRGAVVADPYVTHMRVRCPCSNIPSAPSESLSDGKDKQKVKSGRFNFSKSSSASEPIYPFLILASDGLWDVVAKSLVVEETKKLLRKNQGKKGTSSVTAARHLVRTAIKYGTMDDTSVMVIEFVPHHVPRL